MFARLRPTSSRPWRAGRRRDRRRRGRGDRRGPRAGGARGQGRRRRAGPRARRCPTARARDRHRALGPGRARPHPPRHRARARRGGARPLPGREDLDRPADRERLLLRLRVPRRRHVHRRRLRARSRPRCASTSRPTSRSCARTSRVGRGARALPRRGPALQGRAHRGPRRATTASSTVSLYTNGPFTDLCRGPHAPSTKRIKAFKLQSRRRRLLARRREPHACSRASTAPRSSPRTTSTSTSSRLEQARARDHRSSARELGLFAFSDISPGRGVLAAARHARLQRARRAQPRDGRASAATPRSRPRSSTTPSCGRPPGTGASTASTCSSPRPRTARWRSSR